MVARIKQILGILDNIFKLQEPTPISGLIGEMGKDESPAFQWLLRWNDVRNPYAADKDFKDVSAGYGRHSIRVTLNVNQQLTIEGKKTRALLIDADPAEVAALIGMAYIEPGKQADFKSKKSLAGE